MDIDSKKNVNQRNEQLKREDIGKLKKEYGITNMSLEKMLEIYDSMCKKEKKQNKRNTNISNNTDKSQNLSIKGFLHEVYLNSKEKQDKDYCLLLDKYNSKVELILYKLRKLQKRFEEIKDMQCKSDVEWIMTHLSPDIFEPESELLLRRNSINEEREKLITMYNYSNVLNIQERNEDLLLARKKTCKRRLSLMPNLSDLKNILNSETLEKNGIVINLNNNTNNNDNNNDNNNINNGNNNTNNNIGNNSNINTNNANSFRNSYRNSNRNSNLNSINHTINNSNSRTSKKNTRIARIRNNSTNNVNRNVNNTPANTCQNLNLNNNNNSNHSNHSNHSNNSNNNNNSLNDISNLDNSTDNSAEYNNPNQDNNNNSNSNNSNSNNILPNNNINENDSMSRNSTNNISCNNSAITLNLNLNYSGIMKYKPKKEFLGLDSLERMQLNEQNLVLYHLSQLKSSKFNIFELEKLAKINLLRLILNSIFEEHSSYNEYIDKKCFDSFIHEVATGYNRKVPYHNDIHAADVLQTTYCNLINCKINNILNLSDHDTIALVVAAACHDFRHNGYTNLYHQNSFNLLAITYNDQSILENFHLTETFKLIKEEKFNLFNKLSKEEFRHIRRRMIHCILATDMAVHSKMLTEVKNTVSILGISNGKNNNLILGNDDKKHYDNQQLFLNFLIHSSDISNPTKPTEVYEKWVDLLMTEFFHQGDVEVEQKLPVSPMCDRTNTNVPKSQIGFISFVVSPCFELLSNIFPQSMPYFNQLKVNLEFYQKKCENQNKILVKKK